MKKLIFTVVALSLVAGGYLTMSTTDTAKAPVAKAAKNTAEPCT